MSANFLIAVARHGQTNSNVNGLWVGSGDDPLNETGIEQARMLAKNLSDFNFDLIISSDKRRSIETAEIVSKTINIPFFGQHPVLRDRDYGKVEGLTSKEILDRYGIEMRALSRDLDDFGSSETVDAVMGRVKEFVVTAEKLFDGKNIVAITHGAFIRSFYETFVRNANHLRFTNCSHFILRFEKENHLLVRDLKSL